MRNLIILLVTILATFVVLKVVNLVKGANDNEHGTTSYEQFIILMTFAFLFSLPYYGAFVMVNKMKAFDGTIDLSYGLGIFLYIVMDYKIIDAIRYGYKIYNQWLGKKHGERNRFAPTENECTWLVFFVKGFALLWAAATANATIFMTIVVALLGSIYKEKRAIKAGKSTLNACTKPFLQIVALMVVVLVMCFVSVYIPNIVQTTFIWVVAIGLGLGIIAYNFRQIIATIKYAIANWDPLADL